MGTHQEVPNSTTSGSYIIIDKCVEHSLSARRVFEGSGTSPETHIQWNIIAHSTLSVAFKTVTPSQCWHIRRLVEGPRRLFTDIRIRCSFFCNPWVVACQLKRFFNGLQYPSSGRRYVLVKMFVSYWAFSRHDQRWQLGCVWWSCFFNCGRSCPYQLAVVFEALARVTSLPAVMLLDTCKPVLSSLFHWRVVCAASPTYESTKRVGE